MRPKLLRMFLVEGNLDGIVTMEISNMTIYATSFPRIKTHDFRKRPESRRPGVYFLIGEDFANSSLPLVYVGKANEVSHRLYMHDGSFQKKDDWDRAIVFTSKDDYLTETQVSYLEARIIQDIDEIGMARKTNVQTPVIQSIAESEQAEIEEFYEALKIILKALGYDFLEDKVVDEDVMHEEISDSEQSDYIYEFSIKTAHAKMKIIDGQYVVLKNSTIIKKDRKHIPLKVKKTRNTLVEKGVLVPDPQDDNLYRLTKNYKWNSPSYASSFVAAGNDNGRRSWKYGNKSLGEMID